MCAVWKKKVIVKGKKKVFFVSDYEQGNFLQADIM